MLTSLVFFAEGEAQSPGSGMLLFFPFIIAIMYFMVIRPQRRQQKEHLAKMAALKSGDEIITNGGIHGLITNVSDRTATLKIADNVKIKIEKSAVMSIIKAAPEPEPAPEPATEAQSAA